MIIRRSTYQKNRKYVHPGPTRRGGRRDPHQICNNQKRKENFSLSLVRLPPRSLSPSLRELRLLLSSPFFPTQSNPFLLPSPDSHGKVTRPSHSLEQFLESGTVAFRMGSASDIHKGEFFLLLFFLRFLLVFLLLTDLVSCKM